MQEPPSDWLNLPRQFLRMCRAHMRTPKTADFTGVELTGGGLLTRTLVLRGLLRRHVLAADEKYVGVLMPPSVGGVVTNAALSIDCRVAVNLNYTVTSDVMNECIRQCGIRHVITSKRVLDRFHYKLDAECVLLEDFAQKVTLADKLKAAATAWCMPIGMMERKLGLTELKPDDLLTVIFTSGSTGRPKGVMLTQYNVEANVDGVNKLINLESRDVLLGILPLFHSFGYTTTLWTMLALAPKAVYHFSPLEAREIGKLSRKHGVTIIVATPTFLRSYLRRCEPEDFKSAEVAFTGAEKLPIELADAFEKKFGVRPVEGYGATELSPVVGGNVPFGRGAKDAKEGVKEGSIGRPLCNVKAKVVDLDTGEDLGPNEQGMLLITGPSVMKGYFDRPDLTAEVMRGEWYVTGDVAVIDDEGFVSITGRLNRFSKLAGEMVPHLRIEEAINEVLGVDEEELRLAVTAIPDPKKGEKIVVLHVGLSMTPAEICHKLTEAGLPPLWTPMPDGFKQVAEIPLLGTGKLDLKRLKEIALEAFGIKG